MKKKEFWDYRPNHRNIYDRKAPGQMSRSHLFSILFLCGCVLLTMSTIVSSLFYYLNASAASAAAQTVWDSPRTIAQFANTLSKEISQKLNPPKPDIDISSQIMSASSQTENRSEPNREAAFFFRASESDTFLDTVMGPMLYYRQGDERWGDYLYGGEDPMKQYGCGPTATAMLVDSFTDQILTPTGMADWCAINGDYAVHSGSYHSIIPDTLSAFGLTVESVSDRSYENAASLLQSGHILVALMGSGSLTAKGHFILITNLLSDGKVSIADPSNYENCTIEWDLNQLLSELKNAYDNGAPLWAVSKD